MRDYNTLNFQTLKTYRVSFLLLTCGLLLIAAIVGFNPVNEYGWYFSISKGLSVTLLKMAFDAFKHLCSVQYAIKDRRD